MPCLHDLLNPTAGISITRGSVEALVYGPKRRQPVADLLVVQLLIVAQTGQSVALGYLREYLRRNEVKYEPDNVVINDTWRSVGEQARQVWSQVITNQDMVHVQCDHGYYHKRHTKISLNLPQLLEGGERGYPHVEGKEAKGNQAKKEKELGLEKTVKVHASVS